MVCLGVAGFDLGGFGLVYGLVVWGVLRSVFAFLSAPVACCFRLVGWFIRFVVCFDAFLVLFVLCWLCYLIFS